MKILVRYNEKIELETIYKLELKFHKSKRGHAVVEADYLKEENITQDNGCTFDQYHVFL